MYHHQNDDTDTGYQVYSGQAIQDFHGECVAETEDVADSDGYGDYYDDSVATFKIPDYDWVRFFADDDNDSDFEGF